MPYRLLDPVKISETAQSIENRVTERFPDSGLSKVASEVSDICDAASRKVVEFRTPSKYLRALIGLMILLLIALAIAPFYLLQFRIVPTTLPELIQTIESGINDVVLMGIGIYFLVSVERRFKRSKVLSAVHELRAIAHVIDMHQLTKDPARLAFSGQDTSASPVRVLTPFQLERYLDYCSELLSVLGKVAALYAQHLNDSTALQAIDAVEDLTTSLSRKIWQKILILQGSSRG